jgi:hypothetical protein
MLFRNNTKKMTFRRAKSNLRVFLRVFFRVLCLVCGLWLTSLSLFAQDEPPRRRGSRIIDDTTKQVYGPRTSHYYYEKDVFYNRDTYYQIDTLIRNFHRFDYVQRFDYLYQDLGNMGTAIRPIFYQSPAQIGVTPGFTAYDLYWDTEEVKYYDTKSPFTNLKVDLGGRGRSRTRVAFSRNITPQWNFGFNYRGVFVDKQIQRSGKGDRHARGIYYDIYTAYQSKDSTYRLFFNFRRMSHQVDEYGGVYTEAGAPMSSFFVETAEPWLREAESNDLRANLHLMHQYRVGSALQLYHQVDMYRQTNKFLDDYSTDSGRADFFTRFDNYNEYDSTHSIDISRFRSLRNDVGIKGSLLKLFYNGYYAIRQYDNFGNRVWTDTMQVRTKGTESYLGGRMSLKLDSLVEVNGWLEIQQEGNLRIEGEIKSKWFEAALRQKVYEPTYVQQYYRGHHDAWNNNFGKVESTLLNGYIHYKSRWLSISPGLTFARVRNYVYFQKFEVDEGLQSVLPTQSNGNHIYASPELSLSVTMLRHVRFDARGIYTRFLENTDDAMRIPDLFVNAQLSYANIFFHGNLDMHAGVDVHWQSAYFALGYDPMIQQFYAQSDFQSPSFPIIDVFFNAKIKRGRIFVKYHNLNQLIAGTGYLPTPYYPGVKNIIDFGFDWSFYD